jgi:hypothetical protein
MTYKVGGKVFIAKLLQFKGSEVVFPKGHILNITPDLLGVMSRMPKMFPLVFTSFPGYKLSPREKAKQLLKDYDGNQQAAAHEVRKRQLAAEEFSGSWQYWRLVSITLWRKDCGVSFDDKRKKPRMKNKRNKGVEWRVSWAGGKE